MQVTISALVNIHYTISSHLFRSKTIFCGGELTLMPGLGARCTVCSYFLSLLPFQSFTEPGLKHTAASFTRNTRRLDLRIGEPMQICIHWKDNSPKPVNHHLTLKEGPKVKSDIRRFLAHNILQVGFTLQTSRINNK